MGVKLCEWAILCFAGTNFLRLGKTVFFLLGFNFCDFQKVEHEIKVKQHADIKRARKQVPSDDPFL